MPPSLPPKQYKFPLAALEIALVPLTRVRCNQSSCLICISVPQVNHRGTASVDAGIEIRMEILRPAP